MAQPRATHELNWACGRAVLIPTAAMLWSCAFRLPSGRVFQPFARAPWAQRPDIEPEPAVRLLPGHMRRLGGEFVCLPFGDDEAAPDRPMHGPAADADWRILVASDTEIVFQIDYPAEDDVAWLTRRIAVVRNAPALDLELAIHVRRDCERTLALHPVLRLPDPPGGLRIAAAFDSGLTWPDPLAGTSGLRPGARFTALDAVPGVGDGVVDCADLDLSLPQEELLQLCGVSGPITAAYPAESARCVVAWDLAYLPSCLIWISDRKLATPPWSGRFRGLGIEPAAVTLDRQSPSASANRRAGSADHATALTLHAHTPTRIRYRIAAEDVGVQV